MFVGVCLPERDSLLNGLECCLLFGLIVIPFQKHSHRIGRITVIKGVPTGVVLLASLKIAVVAIVSLSL